MGDLYFDDIEDKSYSDQMILADVEALVKSGQREGTVIDYKSDLSDQDNWPQTVAAFANSFGGLIVFGVEGKNDQPRRVAGFDPKGVEIKTKLTSMVIDRIQPRPDFSVRVVTFDKDTAKEIALLRVAEGRNPPYMHSKDHQHTVYTRIGAQKAEADYLQLSSLFEKRQKLILHGGGSSAPVFSAESQFLAPRPDDSNQPSPQVFHFLATPRNEAVPLRLGGETERQFNKAINDIRGGGNAPLIRSRDATMFRVSENAYHEQRFALSVSGATGFISHPGVRTQNGLMFVPEHFCKYLLDFLSIASLFYQRAAHFYGPLQLWVTMSIAGGADLFDGPLQHSQVLGGAYLFEPPLNRISRDVRTEIEVSMHPLLASRMHEYLEAVLNAMARPHGSVLHASFNSSIKEEVDRAVARLISARG